MGHNVRYPAFCGLWTTKAQTSLRSAVWSAPLLFAHGKCHILTGYQWKLNFLAGHCSWAGLFKSHFVGNPEDSFSRDQAHIHWSIVRTASCEPQSATSVISGHDHYNAVTPPTSSYISINLRCKLPLFPYQWRLRWSTALKSKACFENTFLLIPIKKYFCHSKGDNANSNNKGHNTYSNSNGANAL